MQSQFVDQYCRTLPGARADRPFGPDTQVWKVGGKMFACFTIGGKGVSVSCTDDATARRLIRERRAESAPYLLRGGWVLFPWQTPTEELRRRLIDSYLRVRNGLVGETRAGLPPLLAEDAAPRVSRIVH